MGFGVNRGNGNSINISVTETEVARFVFTLTVRIEDGENGTFYGTFGARGCSFELSTKNGTCAMTNTSAEDGIAVLRDMAEDRSNMSLTPKAVAALPATVELLEQFPYIHGLFNSGQREALLEEAYSKIATALAATV